MSKVERTLGKIVLKCPVLENSIKYSIGKGTERRKKNYRYEIEIMERKG